MREFNEDTRVKIPATIQFMRLGYDYQSLKNIEVGVDIDLNTKIFKSRFKLAIERINGKEITDDKLHELLQEIHNMIKNNDLGKEFYNWLINPVDRIKLIDFDNIENNDFAVVTELYFGNEPKGSFRPDITVLINGIPLAFLEVKKPNNTGGIQEEFKRMINDRLNEPKYKKYFNMLQIVAFSNNMAYEEEDTHDDPKAGSFYTTPNGLSTTFSHFREEDKSIGSKLIVITEQDIKKILKDNNYNENIYSTPEFQTNLEATPCNRFVNSLFSKERIMFFLQYGVMYVEDKVKEKHIMRYPQFFAINHMLEKLKKGEGGIVWHAQGSGKTALSAFSNRVIRDFYSKQGISPRLFFVVDRLDLLVQSSAEFTKRGFKSVNVNSKQEFADELTKPISKNSDMQSLGEFVVVNIHKFKEDMPVSKNVYNVKSKKIIFVDEAHRSYKTTGEFYKNLRLIDKDAIFIALTGTPIINKKERSNEKFGDYIHKYFYDKSIADGYTIRIKKESISATVKANIKHNVKLENPEISDSEIMKTEAYVKGVSRFIEDDFKKFRLNNKDNTVGGMIVCSSNEQAQKIHEWFKTHSDLVTGLVISNKNNKGEEVEDDYKNTNKEIQQDFKKGKIYDILIVQYMLTTGYDAKRLKKMYLMRDPKEHSLLQAISRVNRPYKKPNGDNYKYGYIVDFVDIDKEYETTMENYIKELEKEVDDDEGRASLRGLVIDKEQINKHYHELKTELEKIVDISDLEKLSQSLSALNTDTLYKIRNVLRKIRDCHTEFILSEDEELASQIDKYKIIEAMKTVQSRIDFVNIKSKPNDTLNVLTNEEIVEMIYLFVKTKVEIIDFEIYVKSGEVNRIVDNIQKIRKEIKDNKDNKDIRVVELEKFLKEIFDKMDTIDNLTLEDISNIEEELLEVLERIEKINDENKRLSEVYNGNYAFVRVYNKYSNEHPEDKQLIEDALIIISSGVKNIENTNKYITQGRNNFKANIKETVTPELAKKKLYSKIYNYYDSILEDVYVNTQIYN